MPRVKIETPNVGELLAREHPIYLQKKTRVREERGRGEGMLQAFPEHVDWELVAVTPGWSRHSERTFRAKRSANAPDGAVNYAFSTMESALSV